MLSGEFEQEARRVTARASALASCLSQYSGWDVLAACNTLHFKYYGGERSVENLFC